MRKEQILFIVGVLVILSPFFGLPDKAMTIITVLLGLVVVGMSLRVRNAENASAHQPEVP